MKVWALFSIENEYNQPDNNLVQLFANKPSFEKLLNAVYPGIELQELSENDLIAIVDVLKGIRASIGGTEYRIEEVEVI